MNTTPRILARSIATLALSLIIRSKADAQTNGTWSNLAGGGWGTAANWSGSVIASGTGAIADFSTLNITANATVNLDGARTVGTLRFQDTTPSHNWTLNTGSAGPLTLDVATGAASIQVLNGTATIGAVLAGNDGISVTNGGGAGGTLVLGAANTFTGGLSVLGTVLQLNNAAAAGANVITLESGGNPITRLVLNGGVTMVNPVVIGTTGNVTGVVGAGVIQRAGTGTGTINSPITINGSASAGGHFVGGGDANSALVFNGPISSSVDVTQRAGFVRYGGGGAGYTGLTMTGTGQVGATNGIATSATVSLGLSGAGVLDLNGFDQSLAGLILGNGSAGNNNSGSILLGSGTLSLTGNFGSVSTATANVTHLISATAGGAINLGATNRLFTVPNTLAADDVAIAGATILAPAGLTKIGNGTLALDAVTVAGALVVNEGALQIGRFGKAGSLTTDALTFGLGATALRMKVGTGGDVVNAGILSTNGLATITVDQFAGAIPTGVHNLLGYSGTSPGLTGFILAPLPARAVGTLVDTGTAIALNVTANDRLIWEGSQSGAWNSVTPNWKLESDSSLTAFIENDDVVFLDHPVTSTVDIAANVSPTRVTFANSEATTYTLTGPAGIAGTAVLVKEGKGKVTLQNPNSYVGTTTVNEGTLELDHDAAGNVVLTGSSGVSIAAGAKLELTRDDGGFTFSQNLSGAGTIEVNAHSVAGTATAHSVFMTGDNTAFTGTLRLLSPASGTYRIQNGSPTRLGPGAIEVQTGAQLYVVGNQTYTNEITLAGTGFADANANIGALRMDTGAVWAGNITIAPSGARIAAHNATATVSGNITGGDLSVNAGNYNNNYTLIFTGENSYGKTVIGGENIQTAGVSTRRLNIGSGGTTGTLGSGVVEITGDGQNGQLDFDRSDGYALGAGQTITGVGPQLTRTFLDVNTLGLGFRNDGNAITLGAAAPGSGGSIRIGQTRAGAVATLSGNITTERFLVSSTQANGRLNIGPGTTINANYLSVGEAASATGGVVAQTGGDVNVVGQVRLGHFGTLTATYLMSGGNLSLTGASPTLTPSTATGGGANATGDNNINGGATPTIHGGGIYLGIDGTGVFHHTGGTVTTNWIVLDNRTNTGSAANMDGFDIYRLDGASSVLNLRSTWGLTQRNNSAIVLFGEGTVKVDNSGTGTGTGANLNIPLDATINSLPSKTTNLDTNGAGNAFTLNRNVRGSGTLNLTGGGTIDFTTAGNQLITADLAGTATLRKLGAGVTTLTGSGANYTGAVSVTAGRLDVPVDLAPPSITVADGAAFSGDVTAGAVTLGAVTGSTLFFDPNSPEALTVASLVLAGTTTLDFATAPGVGGTYTVLNYGSLTGLPNFAIANAADYRGATVDTSVTGTVSVDITTKALTWTGAASGVFDTKGANNWADQLLANEQFHAGDTVTFLDGAAPTAVTVASGVSPWKTSVNADTSNYTFTSSGSGLAGPGNLEKTGTSTLTLVGANTYSGATFISGGVVATSAIASLGNGSATNSLVLTGGGRLQYTGNTGADFGASRSVFVGSGGGSISHSNATAVTHIISGNLSGEAGDTLSFHSGLAGAGTFELTGDNSGFLGNITVDAQSTGLTALRFATPSSVPGGGSITLNYPAAGAANTATTLNLPGVSLPATVGLNLTSAQVGSLSLRTQVTTSGDVVIDSPVKLSGSAIVQFSPASGTLTMNGPIGESTPGSFSSVLFFRGAGTSILNSTINLPSGILAQTDGGTIVLNSTGNTFAQASALVGTFRLGAENAVPVTATLNLGQSDGSSPNFNLNGFNQTLAGINYTAGTGGNKTITNTSATPSTLTVNQTSNSTMGGVLAGNLSFHKGGAGNMTLSNANSSFTGDVVVNAGTLTASGVGGAANGPLGALSAAGRSITVNPGATLAFTNQYILGNGIGNTNLPAIVLNQSALTSTRYNVLGALQLNGSSVSQAATDSGNFEGFQFKGPITVGGTSASTIVTTNGKANHLDTNTLFTVGDATGNAAVDLLISAPLRNQSSDFGGTAGGLTKAGAGTLEISSISTYTGATVVEEGVLLVSGNLSGSTAVINGGVLRGGGTVGGIVLNAGGTLEPGTSPGILNTGDTTFAGGTFSLDLEGAVPGAGYDQLNVTGSFALTANTELVINLGAFDPLDNVDTFTIVLNDGADPIALGGYFTFGGLPLIEGDYFTTGAQDFQITYAGGLDGNDVVLSAVPEPGAGIFLLGALAAFVTKRRRRG